MNSASSSRWSQSQSSTQSTAGITNELCECGHPSASRISWTRKNLARRFRNCARIEGRQCGFFMWIDPEICQRAKEVIPNLRDRILSLESRLVDLQRECDLLKSENRRGVVALAKSVDLADALSRNVDEMEAKIGSLRSRNRWIGYACACCIAVALFMVQ